MSYQCRHPGHQDPTCPYFGQIGEHSKPGCRDKILALAATFVVLTLWLTRRRRLG